MTTYTQVGNRIIGDTIICEARQIKKKRPIHKSGRHKIQVRILKDNASAKILKKARFLDD